MTGEGPGSLWLEDDDPWVGPLETDFTRLGTGYLALAHMNVHSILELPRLPTQAVREAYHAIRFAKAEDGWYRASKLLEDLRGYGTRRLPPERYRDLADTVTEHWLSQGKLENAAQRDAISAHLVGMMRANPQDRALTPTLESVPAAHRHAAEYAAARAAEYMRNLSARARHEIESTIYQAQIERATPADLAQRLLTRFGALNRDWRRVAVTEIATNRANGFLAASEGQHVRWASARDACPVCRHHHGKALEVVPSEHPGKDAALMVWIGKPPPPAGTDPRNWPRIPQHPNCRCVFLRVLDEKPADVDPVIEARIQALIALARKPT